ncbi:putative uncharacterized protein DDB_G0277255 [Culex pipiens pallens]|uniref:putative uncharacterized protein DDB_G0277255 n=1 Tax=Culex pipiens pallens TaxID=42434 RepID=UPI001953C29D|nr:putative uncharacterized protein DDB_G0277255 [Culex pipiens pallens]
MKMFVAFLACVAVAAADVSLIHPAGHLEPPVEHLTSKEFNAPWPEKNSWEPLADPHQPISVITNNNNNNNNVAHDGYHYDNNNNQNLNQNFNNNYNNDYNNNYNNDYTHNNNYNNYNNNNQNYNQVATYTNHHQSHQGQITKTNHGQVSFEVTHPYWATSFAKINRFDTWPAAPAPFVAAAPLPLVATAPTAFVATSAPIIATNAAPFVKPAVVYNDQVAKWNNPWAHQHHGWNGPVAKYVAITPGSVHIAPLPGHTVSQKILNLAPAASW